MSEVKKANQGIKKQRNASAAGANHSHPAPDALDELRNTMHGVTVVRHDAADAPLHLHQTTVSAREQQQPALARAVVREGHLRRNDALKCRCMHLSRRVPTCTVRAAASVWKLIQRPLAVVRCSVIASGSSVSRAHMIRAHASSPTIDCSSGSVRSSLKSPSQLPSATLSATEE
jgi:hypothetical protein